MNIFNKKMLLFGMILIMLGFNSSYGQSASLGPVVTSLNDLPEGAIVSILSLRNNKFLSIDGDKYLKAQTDKSQLEGSSVAAAAVKSKVRFKVLRDGNRVGFQRTDDSSRKNLQSRPRGESNQFEVRFENTNFMGFEKFEIEFNSDGVAFLKSSADNSGYLSSRLDENGQGDSWSQGGRVWSRDGSGNPAAKGSQEKFKIVRWTN